MVDLRADVNRDGVVSLTDPTEDASEGTWGAKYGAVFLANLGDGEQTRALIMKGLGLLE